MMALVNPARSPNLPVPNVKRGSSACLRAFDFHPSSSTFVRAAAFDSNPGLPITNDRYGTRFHLNPRASLIVIAEVGYQLTPSPENKGEMKIT
jgi:hypothetical protein